MKHQLQTIREALESADQYQAENYHDYEGPRPAIAAALTALSELEAMVGEQEPVSGVVLRDDWPTLLLDRDIKPTDERLYRAAPVAQQPQYEAADMASAHNDGFRAGAASVAQQPQAEAVHNKPVRVCHIKDVACSEAAVKCGECPDAAPQQAETVPSDVVRDAERYRWLRNESWAGYNTGKGTPSVYTVDGAGNRRMMLAEEAMDEAIDAAMAQGEKP